MKKLQFFILIFCISLTGYSASPDSVTYKKWRLGLYLNPTIGFKNIAVEYGIPNSTQAPPKAALGGGGGIGATLFLGYRVHKYVVIEVHAGGILNMYLNSDSATSSQTQSTLYYGHFNKVYIKPTGKLLLPLMERERIAIMAFLGGGFGLYAPGRFYGSANNGSQKVEFYAKYKPMIGPHVMLGIDFRFGRKIGISSSFQYMQGTYDLKSFHDSTKPNATAPAILKTLDASGLAFTVGFVRYF
jgi:hypothetical protein